MMPTRRDLKFDLPADRIGDWHPDGPYVTHFMNTLSVFFPEGERFFIHSVRHFRDRISDPQLKQAVTAFIGQEAMHGREHEDYNAMVAAAGYPVEKLEARVTALLEWFKRHAPASTQLGGTIALEHFTAILANQLLRDDAVLGDAQPHFKRLWRWHAYEETEHKAVAFDVWRTAMKPNGHSADVTPGHEVHATWPFPSPTTGAAGGSPSPKGRGKVGISPREMKANLRAYAERSATMVLATVVFWTLVAEFHWRMVRADPTLPRGLRARVRGYAGLARNLFVKPGVLRRLIPDYLDYFRPSFHPWDHDNRHLLAGLDALAAETEIVHARAA